jgi:DNA-binding XRE family transcriptional regulator
MPKEYKNLSPFAEWLVKLAEERETTITALAKEAGLSPGTLRYLLVEPHRKPSLETCLRISAVSGRPVAELLALGGQDADQPIDPYHPDRLKIMDIFDHLPPVGRLALLKVAQVFSSLKATNENKQDKAENVL